MTDRIPYGRALLRGSLASLALFVAAQAAAQQPLWAARDRLLDAYAAFKGMPDRCDIWLWMTSPAVNAGGTDTRKYVFLTITHNLWLPFVLAPGAGRETAAQQERVLDHVTHLYAVKDDGGRRCGGGEDNRLFGGFDAVGAAAVRDLGVGTVYGMFGPMGWRKSGDLAGPHAPFTGSRESQLGRPRAQIQYFRTDAEARTLGRPEVAAVIDPHAFEIDLDYNWLHDSNPTCSYGGVAGYEAYRKLWGEGAGGPPVEYDYRPGGCAGARINAGGVVDARSYHPWTTAGAAVAIFGAGFDPAVGKNEVWFAQAEPGSGKVTAVRAVVTYASASQINVQVPVTLKASSRAGLAWVHVVSGGRRTNAEGVRVD